MFGISQVCRYTLFAVV